MLLTAACVTEGCGPTGAACPAPPIYDLVVTEADSGKVGISTGPAIAFVLDGSRDQLITSPRLAVSRLSDPYAQFPGRRAFTIDARTPSIVDVTSTGKGRSPFKFRVIVGTGLNRRGLTVVHPGDIVIEESPVAVPLPSPVPGPPSPLTGPTFELVQDSVAVGTHGRLLSTQLSPTRRAFRAKQLGVQEIGDGGYIDRVLVADAPQAFAQFIDAETAAPSSMEVDTGVDSRFVIVFIGDRVATTWTANPSYAIMRLPDADVGPQPPGATLVPFRVMTEGPATLQLRTASKTVSVSISGGVTCLPDDFPRYPLAHTMSIDFRHCQVDLISKDSQSQILSFYRMRLNEGDWRVVSVKGSSITFSRRSDSAVGGTVETQSGGIHVVMN